MAWWNPFAGMEEISFKPVAGGYVYPAPNPWIFGPARYYLLNEAQKTELAAKHRSMMLYTFWLIVLGGGIGGPLATASSAYPGAVGFGICVAVGLAIGAAINAVLAHNVQPVLAGLTPTDQRITQRDMFSRQVSLMTPRYVIGFGVVSLVLFALAALRGVYDGWDFAAVIGAGLFGACTLYWATVFIVNRNRTAA